MALPWGVAADTNAEAQRSEGERTGLAAELGIMGGARVEVWFGCSSAMQRTWLAGCMVRYCGHEQVRWLLSDDDGEDVKVRCPVSL